jgi:hypothetical protein
VFRSFPGCDNQPIGEATAHIQYGAYMALGALSAGFASLHGETRSRVAAIVLRVRRHVPVDSRRPGGLLHAVFVVASWTPTGIKMFTAAEQ